MFTTAYKLNNSYTTYVIHDYGECYNDYYFHYQKTVKPLEWKIGAKVKHSFHGVGFIQGISDHLIIVQFSESKTFKRLKNFQVTFKFIITPKEIDNLRLCY